MEAATEGSGFPAFPNGLEEAWRGLRTGKAKLAGRFPELEEELAGLGIGGGYAGPSRSPDRADAMVWALTELMATPSAEPRVRVL